MWLLLILLLAAIIQVRAQNVTSNLRSNHRVCPGEKVTFTCDVQGPSLAWSSEDYIGSTSDGRRLEFGAADMLNTTFRRSSTVATLLRKNGVMEIVSQLKIIASAMYPTSSVVCHDTSTGTSRSIYFNVSGEYFSTLILSIGPSFPNCNALCTTKCS
jgi:hypothetical protein